MFFIIWQDFPPPLSSYTKYLHINVMGQSYIGRLQYIIHSSSGCNTLRLSLANQLENSHWPWNWAEVSNIASITTNHYFKKDRISQLNIFIKKTNWTISPLHNSPTIVGNTEKRLMEVTGILEQHAILDCPVAIEVEVSV